MKQRNKDLFLFLILAITNMIWACFSPPFVVIALVLALPLVFLAPGYLLIELLARKREYDRATHLLLTLGLSLSIDILGGFLLNIISVGLTAMTWSIFLGVLTIVGALLCMLKRRRWQVYRDRKQSDLPTRYEFLLLTLTMYVVLFAFIYTTNSITYTKYQKFTQFWLSLHNRQSHICTIQPGIYSSEAGTTTYQVDVKENKRLAAHWSSITLVPQQKWQGQLPIAIKDTQTTQIEIEANLYRQQDPNSVYRTVRLLLIPAKTMCT